MEELSDDAFYEVLNNEDHLGMVVRGHIHIEHWINAFLGLAMPHYPKYEKSISADYETKVLLCCALGLTPDLKTPLTSIGSLRNRFAHRLAYKLTSSDVSDLYASLSGPHKTQIKYA